LSGSLQFSVAENMDFPFLKAHDHHGSEPIGWLRYGFFWDSIPFMNLLHILEGQRSRGIGRQLVKYWENAMRAQGYDSVMTSTLADETAQHFYRKLGYQDSGALLLPAEALEIIFWKML
jgi:ribosomal protein S18 acetylase RimI-like enzyme